MTQSVLIVSDDAEFARSIIGRWQNERTLPSFTVMSPKVWNAAANGNCQVAIIGPAVDGSVLRIGAELDRMDVLVVCVTMENTAAHAVRDRLSRAIVLRSGEQAVDAIVPVAIELLRRVEMSTKLRDTEKALRIAERNATLGRYMLEQRHGLNNALTSLLGNAELLLLEPGAFSAQVREQLETIHCMSLRMHEVIQRFTSLETELSFAEKQSQGETVVC